MRVEPDERFIASLDRELQIFNLFIENVMEKIRATHEVPVPQGRLALKGGVPGKSGHRPVTEKTEFSLLRIS
jgi:hypothetical protein